MDKTEKLNQHLETREDAIRITLSLGIIGFYSILFKLILTAMMRQNGPFDWTTGIFKYFIVRLYFFYCVAIGCIIPFVLIMYIICLTSQYTYRKYKTFVTDKDIQNLYDTGVRLFWVSIPLYIFMAWIINFTVIFKKYFPPSIFGIKEPELWFAIIIPLGCLLIKKLIEAFKKLIKRRVLLGWHLFGYKRTKIKKI